MYLSVEVGRLVTVVTPWVNTWPSGAPCNKDGWAAPPLLTALLCSSDTHCPLRSPQVPSPRLQCSSCQWSSDNERLYLREGFRKKTYFLWSFAKPGGGVGEGSKKTILLFWKVFFQRACRIILGPLKHVLHLVWSAFVKYTANRTALKVELYDFLDGPPAPLNSQSMEKVNHYNL